jgi:hypothetical protein
MAYCQEIIDIQEESPEKAIGFIKGLFRPNVDARGFDDYWMNYKKITIPDGKGGTKKITNLKDFVKYRNGDVSLIVPKHNAAQKKGN